MSRPKDSRDITVTAIFALAILVMIGTGVFMLAVRPPSLTTAQRLHDENRDKTESQAFAAAKNAKEQAAAIVPRVWALPQDQIGPAALAKVTTFAKAHQVKLTSFRPQRVADADGLTQIPFMMTLDGAYPNVVAFVKDIEASDSRLAVNQVQLSSSDGATDKVSASIGLVAYADLGGNGNG